uniref:Uncharacterized protein n=1 Tax=Davidia involucrata TaxID=16924 RepID=A0A5B7BRG3_DAVIN
MGANFCCLRQSSSEQHPKTVGPSSPSSSESLKKEERQFHTPENRFTVVGNLSTLEECLTASPGSNSPCINATEFHVFKQLPRRGHISSPRVQTKFFTPRNSFSSDRVLEKIDEGDEEDMSVSSMSRTQSGRLKKRVSFKLPEEADIFIFYSPKETFEE